MRYFILFGYIWCTYFVLDSNKLSSSFSKSRKNNFKKHHNLSSSFLHISIKKSTISSSKKSCCPHILLFPFPYFSPIFILPTTRKLPCYKALKEKQPQKGQKKKRTVFSYYKKNYHKNT